MPSTIARPSALPKPNPWPRGPTADRDRLLRHLQADAAQVQAEVQWVGEQTRHYLELEATRPLTPNEVAQVRALIRQGAALRLRLRRLRAEFTQLQDHRRYPGTK